MVGIFKITRMFIDDSIFNIFTELKKFTQFFIQQFAYFFVGVKEFSATQIPDFVKGLHLGSVESQKFWATYLVQ